MLEKEGFQVIVAATSGEAIDIAKDELPDLVLLDIVVPDRGGFEVLQTLRLFDGTKNTPVIFLTSCDRETDRQQADELGAVGYFIKSPSISGELVKHIKKHLASKA
jgi:DNA-binding response OmpR family regulator